MENNFNVDANNVKRGNGAKETLDLVQPSATFPKVAKIEEALLGSKIIQYCEYALEAQEPVQFISEPGVGKTSCVTNYFKQKGLNVLLLHMPTIDLDRLSVAMPVDGPDGAKILKPILLEQLKEADVVVFDEPRRAKPTVRNAMMEMLQEKSLGGIKLKPHVAFILCNNSASEGGVNTSGTDLAQESRYITIELKPADVPWQAALAATYKDTDLSAVFKRYNMLEAQYPGATKFLSPRTLDHVIWNILVGLPPILGLPLMAGPRERIVVSIKDKNGGREEKDVTQEILSGFCQDLGVGYTEPTVGTALKAIAAANKHGKNIIIQGPPGVGKTSYVVAELDRLGINSTYWSMQNVNPDEHLVPFPDGDKLGMMISSVLKPESGEEYTLVADEYYRGKPSVLNMMLEVTQGGTLGGQCIPVRNVIALTNPRVVAGQRQEVGKPDRAQADRFYASVVVTEEDIPANDYLITKYGETAEIFLAWWKNDISEVERTHITKRTLEKMIKSWNVFQSIEAVKVCRPYLKDDYVPVPIHDLQRRLKRSDTLTFAALAAKKDEYLAKLILRDEESGQPVHPADHLKINQIIAGAELQTLTENKDLAIELIAVLDTVYRPGLLKHCSDPKLLVLRADIMRKGAALANKLQEEGKLRIPRKAAK